MNVCGRHESVERRAVLPRLAVEVRCLQRKELLHDRRCSGAFGPAPKSEVLDQMSQLVLALGRGCRAGANRQDDPDHAVSRGLFDP